MNVCRELKWTPWELFDQLKARDLYLNVSLEDWLDSASIELADSALAVIPSQRF